ncbi:uncharacterized protein BP5553_01914 [Venustampulla echinocandica]|uniref:Uncharacterized protein n=1 Tax=Venustampulla echinocandica TaxID=2656787 RepID=A0A370U2F5_9HELO|nr:uncharacterized protein BP5553_01914 [Venustampulla echinocandica]RDL41935.1 hypothetical protein BP5553_01914 [Venustampulla echinocandica]
MDIVQGSPRLPRNGSLPPARPTILLGLSVNMLSSLAPIPQPLRRSRARIPSHSLPGRPLAISRDNAADPELGEEDDGLVV